MKKRDKHAWECVEDAYKCDYDWRADPPQTKCPRCGSKVIEWLSGGRKEAPKPKDVYLRNEPFPAGKAKRG